MEYLDIKKRINKNVDHQGIGGKEIMIEFEIPREEFLKKVDEWNPACVNLFKRRFEVDFEDENLKYKIYYGKVDHLGYAVLEDELEDL